MLLFFDVPFVWLLYCVRLMTIYEYIPNALSFTVPKLYAYPSITSWISGSNNVTTAILICSEVFGCDYNN